MPLKTLPRMKQSLMWRCRALVFALSFLHQREASAFVPGHVAAFFCSAESTTQRLDSAQRKPTWARAVNSERRPPGLGGRAHGKCPSFGATKDGKRRLSNSSEFDNGSEGETAQSSKELVLVSAFLSLGAVAAAAKLGLIPGPIGPNGEITPYRDPLILRDVGGSVLCAVLGVIFVKICTSSAQKGLLEPRDSRKIIHTLSAPLFILVWPIFSDAVGARAFAGVVPVLNAVRLFVAGSGAGGDEKELANAVSRSGDAKEALGGPFVYVLILATATVLFWRDNVTGIVALSNMAAGDGLADLVGRRFGKTNKWLFSQNKSVAGSLAFVAGSTACSVGLISWLAFAGVLEPQVTTDVLVMRVVLISAFCAFVELLPLGDDNWTVPLTAAVLAALVLEQA